MMVKFLKQAYFSINMKLTALVVGLLFCFFLNVAFAISESSVDVGPIQHGDYSLPVYCCYTDTKNYDQDPHTGGKGGDNICPADSFLYKGYTDTSQDKFIYYCRRLFTLCTYVATQADCDALNHDYK